MMVDDVLVVVGDTVSCDGGMVVSTNTVVSVADGGGRGGDADDSDVLVVIDELVGSRDRPIVVGGGDVGSRLATDSNQITKRTDLCGSGKKNFTDLSKSPHSHCKKVHPKKSGRDSSRDLSVPVLIQTIRRLTKKKVLKKDKIVNQLTNDLQECMKELGVVKAILPKVFQERDFMWEEVKSYREMNMLLNYEINMLKKKVDTLDEDFLMKEGQIKILKDSIGKPFDLFASPDSLLE
ncbi:hypothetical protein CQW23_29175 [Capsicum baccatum]|uniref:Uncharacterized protein n=1 Tax=Capsicum baccatum TaxID=33114 RepID=A0A2G2VIQ1_CAPBA|nr:hypothetical protein CQW23_29175 [Capsicum baccatum]